MGLVYCPICDKRVSNKAINCVRCGAVLDNVLKIETHNDYNKTIQTFDFLEKNKLIKNIKSIYKDLPNCFSTIKRAYAILNDLLCERQEKIEIICCIDDDLFNQIKTKNYNKEMIQNTKFTPNSIYAISIWNKVFTRENV